jgi:hypothetical protein
MGTGLRARERKKPKSLTTKKANAVFAFAWVVGADGLEPPTYAL